MIPVCIAQAAHLEEVKAIPVPQDGHLQRAARLVLALDPDKRKSNSIITIRKHMMILINSINGIKRRFKWICAVPRKKSQTWEEHFIATSSLRSRRISLHHIGSMRSEKIYEATLIKINCFKKESH